MLQPIEAPEPERFTEEPEYEPLINSTLPAFRKAVQRAQLAIPAQSYDE